MKLWVADNWDVYFINNCEERRTGLTLRFESGVDAEIKKTCKCFCKWLRTRYLFPIRVPIYFKKSEYIESKLGVNASAIFFGPYSKNFEPYIRIATEDVYLIKQKHGEDEALLAVLGSIVHELSHYFQWIKDMDFTSEQSERQAKYYKGKIITEYLNPRKKYQKFMRKMV